MRILLVKTSSLGDVVHNLPVASDIRTHFPDAQIDWLVEEGFADIPRLHPAVSNVIPVATRRWRKQLFAGATWQEIKALKTRLQTTAYDLVLDTQGLVKSALLVRWAKGEKHGYDADSIREPLAARAYTHTHQVSREYHAVQRNRLLAGAALGYEIPAQLNYGITAHPLKADWLPTQQRYVVLLTATSRDDKLWADDAWVSLGQQLALLGYHAILPAGSAIEQQRAQRIALAINGTAAPRLGIQELAGLMSGAHCVIGVDTGLTHLAAALGRPTLAIYTATNPNLTGVSADSPFANLGGINTPPTVEAVLSQCKAWLT